MQRALSIIGVLALSIVATEPPVAGEPKPCSEPEYRQFDYWLGDWKVFNADGEKIGENRITLEQGQCVLHEHWKSTRGNTGESFNMYDRGRKVWHQTWVAATGNLLLLEGGLRDGNMVLDGEQTLPDGETVTNRISWIRQDDGSVHQVWEQSVDGGATWEVAFLGVYRKKAGLPGDW